MNEFQEKIRSIQFGKGTKTNPRNYYDADALREQNLTPDRDEVLGLTGGVGPLKWHRGEPYKRDRHSGEYERATLKDMETLLGPET